MTYRLGMPADASHRDGNIHLTWIIQDPSPNFAGFALIASDSGPPDALDNGVELFRWIPQNGEIGGDHEAKISLMPIQQQRWPRFFCKVIVLDPTQRHTVLIIHPNTCMPVSSEGIIAAEDQGDTSFTIYRPGVPETVICPHCFRWVTGISDMCSLGFVLNERTTVATSISTAAR